MYISLNWIREFTALPAVEVEELANSFTMTTAEVEAIIEPQKFLSQIKIGEIKSIRKHPDADKLNLVTFDYGIGELKEVVCGASNVRVGLKIAYAPLGVTLPDGLTLEPKKIRGFLSEGMICSEQELGFAKDSLGIMELTSDAEIGMSMASYLQLNCDTLLDIDNKSITHRPDLWGHFGLAREFAAAYQLPLNDPFNKTWQEKCESSFNNEPSPIIPQVESDSSALIYYGLSLSGIEVQDSPSWMQQRLIDLGLRPINNIVDISNYVMLELGIPLHIFDRDKIAGSKIKVHRLTASQDFLTLDEVSRTLTTDDTVISDNEKILVLAGVMGGASSGVSNQTTNIFIEVANWQDHQVRKTSTRLGLRTDSSQRYEKSLDSQLCYRTLLRTLELVLKSCPKAKVIGKAEVAGPQVRPSQPIIIESSANNINKVLGTQLSENKIQNILNSLSFNVQASSNKLRVEVPSFRATKDIECEADLIEEVGRMIGYDNIESVAPTDAIKPVRLSPHKLLHRKIQDFLSAHFQSLEIMTYPLIGAQLLTKAQWPHHNEELKLVNSLSQDADRMRPTLLAHALEATAMNQKNYESFKFFEIGRSYFPDTKNFSREHHQLIICSYSKNHNPFMNLVNAVESLLRHINISYQLSSQQQGKFINEVIPQSWAGAHPFQYFHIRIMGKLKGAISSIHPMVLRNFKIKGQLACAVIDLQSFEQRELKSTINYRPLPKYPQAQFDCSVQAPIDTAVTQVLEVFKKIKIPELKTIKVTDVFPMDNNLKSITLRTVFQSQDRTLDHEFMKSSEQRIVDSLAVAGFPLKEG